MGELTTLDYFEFQAKSGIWGSLYDPKNPASYPFIVRFKKCVDLMDPIENKIIVDLGCGTGVLIPHVIQNGGKYIGVDISQNMIDVIKEEYSSLIESKKVSLYYGDITTR
ncbi:MAG: class I SAM-dependent methyltransferase [Bacteroidetes bacterium]|nr:class I SAM-dependent methyltransferase [Bacteroidota bacterium]